MIERGGRFTLADGNDEWIVKPPHPSHPNIPANEYTMLRLAAAAGIQTPEVKLVKLVVQLVSIMLLHRFALDSCLYMQ